MSIPEKPAAGQLSVVNATGFAFQLAVEELVARDRNAHGWTVTSREHGWRDAARDPQFIDLVLTRGQIHLVVECKRLKDAQWVFLVPDGHRGRTAEPTRHCRAAVLSKQKTREGPRAATTLADFPVDPPSWESAFCSVGGASDRDRPLLDRLCAHVATSADAILDQQLTVDGRRDLHFPALRSDVIWIAVPVIITTESLWICRFDPGSVSPERGEIVSESAEFEQVNVVRYRKSFDAHVHPPVLEGSIASVISGVGMLERYSQRTVFVVTARHLVEWLAAFDLDVSPHAVWNRRLE